MYKVAAPSALAAARRQLLTATRPSHRLLSSSRLGAGETRRRSPLREDDGNAEPPRPLGVDVLEPFLRDALLYGRLDGALSRAPQNLKRELAAASSAVLRRPDLFSRRERRRGAGSEGGFEGSPGSPGLLPWEFFPATGDDRDDWSGAKVSAAEGWISDAAGEAVRRRLSGASGNDGDDDPSSWWEEEEEKEGGPYDGGSEAAFPEDMTAEWREAWGTATSLELADTLSGRPPVSVRVGRRHDLDAMRRSLSTELGVNFRPSQTSPVGLLCDTYRPVMTSAAYREGSVVAQDEGSQLLAAFALWPEHFARFLSSSPGIIVSGGIRPPLVPLPKFGKKKKNLKVVDACAGAGGKALALADYLGGRGRVYAYDTAEWKLRRLRERASVTDLRNIQTVPVPEGDELSAIPPQHLESADVVLVDAPCSGWGTLRRNPDVKFRQTGEERGRLEELQLRLLRVYSRLVRPGGRLVYGTCTFRPQETRDVVSRFLADDDGTACSSDSEAAAADGARFSAGPAGYYGPSPDSDGFFFSSLTKSR